VRPTHSYRAQIEFAVTLATMQVNGSTWATPYLAEAKECMRGHVMVGLGRFDWWPPARIAFPAAARLFQNDVPEVKLLGQREMRFVTCDWHPAFFE